MKKNLLYPHVPIRDLKEMINGVAAKHPDKAAFQTKKNGEWVQTSYSEFAADINALGTKLYDMDLKDAFIGVIGENRYEWCVTYMAVVNGTGVIVPIDKELGAKEIQYIASESNIRMLVFSGKLRQKVLEVADACPSIEYLVSMDETAGDELALDELMTEGADLVEAGVTQFLEAEIDPREMRMLLFTSGTTGVAKGVMLCHDGIASNISSMKSFLEVTEEDSSLSILPIHHSFECTCGFLTIIASGGTVSFCEGLKYIAQNIRETKPTLLVVVPLILENVYSKVKKNAESSFIRKVVFRTLLGIGGILPMKTRRKLFSKVHNSLGGKVHHVICGASALSPTVSRALEKMGLVTLQGYGLTECSPVAAGNYERFYKHGALGMAIPGVEMKLLEPDKDGIGEIMVKGPNVMLGYYKNPEATAEVMDGDWFHTGDFGRVDKDGFYFMTGRKKNLIITKTGKNIFPEELEEHLNDSPFIVESVVTGSEEDITKEDFINAHIVPNIEKIKESLSGKLPNLEDIRKVIGEEVKKINKRLPAFKRIKIFHIRDKEFEKTTTKKIKRHTKNN